MSAVRERLLGFLRGAGVNRAVAFGSLARLTTAAFALAGILLVAWRFPPELQGYHFTFLSLLQLQAFGELGLLTIFVPVASHEWARLRLEPSGRVEGDADARSRLISLGRFAFAWFSVAGLAVAVVVGAGGWAFFSRSAAAGVTWAGPWAAVCVLTGLKMASVPALGLLEGTNQVADMHFARWTGALVSGTVFAGAVAAGLELWSMAAALGAETAWLGARLLAKHRRFLAGFAARPEGPVIRWARDLRPLQARVAVSWMCGYFAFHVFTPLLFRWHGPAAAGRWGLTWNMFGLVTSVGGLWIGTRAAQFGIWISRRDYASLDAEFSRLQKLSVGLTAAGAAALWAVLRVFEGSAHPWASRVLGWDAAALLAAGAVLMQISYGHSTYLRAHRKEPFMWLSVAQAAVSAGGAVLLGAPWGALGMAAGYAAGAAMVVPAGWWIWAMCRRAWHAPEGG